MAVRWTDEQQWVIDSRDRSLLVSAAAGSGKTAVLVERIIRRILDRKHPADIGRMLVVTFTRAAASEIRERIRTAIEHELEQDPGNAHLEQQAVTAQYAQITTIHSFCLYILREYFDRTDLDPAFRVADEGEILLLRADVMKELLEERYASEDAGFLAFAETFAPGKTDEGLTDLVFRVYDFSRSNPWPEEWIEDCRREIEDPGQGGEESRWMTFLRKDVSRKAKELIGDLEEAARLAEDEGITPYLPVLDRELEQLVQLRKAESYRDMASAAAMMTWETMPRIGKKLAEDIDPVKKKKVFDVRSRVKKDTQTLIGNYFSQTPEEAVRDMGSMRDHLLELLRLAEDFGCRFRQRKREKNIVDFDDLEHIALEILSAPAEDGPGLREGHPAGPVADELSEMFDEILVDEYQDSNLVQEQLIRYLSGERRGCPNVVMVGDVKQSIYKFRLARPDLFLEKYRTYRLSDKHHGLILLTRNFRSRREVIESVNEVFARIMTEELGGIYYGDAEALHPGAEFPEADEERVKTELLLMDTGDQPGGLNDDAEDLTKKELEAGMIAREIRRLTDPAEGLSVRGEDGKQRKANFGDIVILLRSAEGWAQEFAEVLMRQGIPAYAETGRGYFDAMEVETVLNVLAVIDNPVQDIPLAAVLRAPFCGLTDEELALIRAEQKQTAEDDGKKGSGLYGAVKGYTERHSSWENDIAEKLRKALALVGELRAAAAVLPMNALLYRIYDRTGYYLYASALPGGEVRRANLDMLVEKASAYEETSYRGVFHFLRYIGELKKYDTDFGEAQADGSRADAVRIMTIHKSKGLEFPIVFVAGLSKNFNKKDIRGSVLVDEDLGLGTDFIDRNLRVKSPTLKKNVMKERMEQEQLGEELRVLYVAMTRAKEKLYLTAALPDPAARLEKKSDLFLHDGHVPSTVLRSAVHMLDWIFMSMAREDYLEPSIGIHILKPGQIVQSAAEELMERDAPAPGKGEEGEAADPAYRNLLLRAGEFVYPCPDDTRLTVKMSVSGLKERHLEEDEEAARLAAAELEEEAMPSPRKTQHAWDSKEGAERGTAYHRLLSLLPFEDLGAAPDGEKRKRLEEAVRALAEKGAFSAREKELVKLRDIGNFLESPLGIRACAAAGRGELFREQQFVIGVPAREVGDWDSDELVVIQGIIDAFFEEEDGLVLYDYKTDRVDSPEELAGRYTIQLDFYERALAQITGKPVKERYLYSFRFGAIRV